MDPREHRQRVRDVRANAEPTTAPRRDDPARLWRVVGVALNLLGIAMMIVFSAAVLGLTYGHSLLGIDAAGPVADRAGTILVAASWTGLVIALAGAVCEMIAEQRRPISF